MSAPDVSALIDFATSPSTPVPTTPQPTESPVEETPVDETVEETSPESTETSEGGEGQEEAAPEAPVDARKNPQAIRNALKAWRDSDPKNAPIARELHNVLGRWNAMSQIFPKVEDAKSAKAILDAVGGHEGIAGLQATLKGVSETDTQLYAGDPKVLDTLYEDMKGAGKQEAFSKLASPFLDKLQSVDPEGYKNVLVPHLHSQLVNANFPGVVAALGKLLTGDKPNLGEAKEIIDSMQSWFQGLDSSVKKVDKTKLDPERQAFEKERQEFQSQRQKEFQETVNKDWNTENSRALGTALKDYLKYPFAKNWTDATKQSVAREITSTLLDELKQDKTYQSQMDAFWAQKQPDKSKILDFHKAKLGIVADRIVKQVLEARYPGFQKSKVTMAPKAGVKTAQAAQTSQTNKPMFVSAKPKENEIDWSKDPQTMLYITGRAFLKNGRFISWNPKYK